MNKVIRIIMLVIVNQFFASQLELNSLTEVFWFSMVSMSGIIYGIMTVLDNLNTQEVKNE